MDSFKAYRIVCWCGLIHQVSRRCLLIEKRHCLSWLFVCFQLQQVHHHRNVSLMFGMWKFLRKFLVLDLLVGMGSLGNLHLGIQIGVVRMVEFVFFDGTKLPKIQQNSINHFRRDSLTIVTYWNRFNWNYWWSFSIFIDCEVCFWDISSEFSYNINKNHH